MTDITDQDRRLALRWCDMLGDSTLHKEAAATRRVILATVEAPAPTLAEELRHIAEHWEGWATETITSAIRAAADRAEQIEEERDMEKTISKGWMEAHQKLAEHHAETLERDGQKGAESNAETPDPADVQPGEAWLVEVNREKRTAVKDTDAGVPWNTVNTNGVFRAENDDDVTLVTRLVPAPRVITNPDDLNRAKRNTIIRDKFGVVCERAALGDGWFTTGHGTDQTPYIQLPATVLWEPGA